MRVAVLFSGGKDSCYTTWLLQHQAWDIPLLITMRPSDLDSRMFHSPGIEWTMLQAEAMGIPQSFVDTKNGDLDELRRALVTARDDYRLDGLATGAVASDYQKRMIDQVCDSVGIKSLSPLWHKNPLILANDLLQADFEIIVTRVAAGGLDESWLGITLDHNAWNRLARLSQKYKVHLTGEGGEYETFVQDAPHFSRKIRIDKSRKVWDGQSGRLIIESASLSDKLTDRGTHLLQHPVHVHRN